MSTKISRTRGTQSGLFVIKSELFLLGKFAVKSYSSRIAYLFDGLDIISFVNSYRNWRYRDFLVPIIRWIDSIDPCLR
jgi:hypothetical protein